MQKNDFSSIPDYAVDFLKNLGSLRNASRLTVEQYYYDLRLFFRWIKQNGRDIPLDTIDASDVSLSDFSEIQSEDLIDYLYFLRDYVPSADGVDRKNDAVSLQRKISSLKTFYKYLYNNKKISSNPTLGLETPKAAKKLPVYLTIEESLKLLQSVDGEYKERNFAIITLFLNCGLRLSELVGINISDISSDNTLRVTGKGNKQRLIYLNESCISAINEYLPLRESKLIRNKDEKALFISRNGKRISNRMVQTLVERMLTKAGLDTHIFSTHKLRHTAATLMYQNGVDVRVLQEVLGHSNLGTTQIYTHLGKGQIKDALERNPLNNNKK